MEVGVLGQTEVRRGEVSVDVGTHKQRALLAALALSRGRPVATDTIIDLLWGDEPPRSVSGTLQAYVSGLRKTLEPDRPARTAASVLVTTGPGYALSVPDEALDAVRFERWVTEVHHRDRPHRDARRRESLHPRGAAHPRASSRCGLGALARHPVR